MPEYTWNRPKIVLYPGGGTREYLYDGLMRLKQLTANDPGGNPLLDYSYEYDPAGNIERKTTEHGAYTYGYDAASRLTSANNPSLDNETYTYDAVGNRTTASNATGSIEHNQNNELRVYGDLTYDYDANGNLTEITLDTQRLFLYTYTTDNRLVKVENGVGGVIAEYYYDPFGRRLWKDVSGTRTYFFYSDEGLIAEYDASGNEIRNYGYQPDSTWTTDPLWLKQNGEYYFYQNDHLGTPQKLVQQNGAVVWSASYTAFGQTTVEVETVTNNLRFPGQYFDTESGLHYNWFRYYAPGIGRYVRTDPLGLKGGCNLFIYVENYPITRIDPSGKMGRFPSVVINTCQPFEHCLAELELRWTGCAFDWIPYCLAIPVGALCVKICVAAGPGFGICLAGCAAGITGIASIYSLYRTGVCQEDALEEYKNCVERNKKKAKEEGENYELFEPVCGAWPPPPMFQK